MLMEWMSCRGFPLGPGSTLFGCSDPKNNVPGPGTDTGGRAEGVAYRSVSGVDAAGGRGAAGSGR